MLTAFLTPADPRWEQVLRAARHDIYDLPGYVALTARCAGAEPLAFYAVEDDCACLIPLLRRDLPRGGPEGWSDAVSPYGYSGALFVGGEEWAPRAVRAFRESCAEQRILSVLVRLHPLLPVPTAALDSAGMRVVHGETVWVDLAQAESEWRAGIRQDHRTGVRRLRREGFLVSVDDWTLYERFVAIYAETMERLAADDSYRFGDTYFGDLKKALGSHLHLLSVVGPDGAVAAAGLFTEIGGIVQFHLSGTAGAYRKLAPSKLMIEGAIEWARAGEHRALHLGGGVGVRRDSLFDFKAGFSPRRARFETWRMVCDEGRYAQLAKDAGANGDYFPAYRRAA